MRPIPSAFPFALCTVIAAALPAPAAGQDVDKTNDIDL